MSTTTATTQHLNDALAIMDSDPQSAPIATFIRAMDVRFASFETDKNAIAVYNPRTKLIWINTMYPCDIEELAVTLVHEGTHAMDYANGTAKLTGSAVPIEFHAYTVMAEYWDRRFPNGRHVTNDENEKSVNEWVTFMKKGTLHAKVENDERMRSFAFLFD